MQSFGQAPSPSPAHRPVAYSAISEHGDEAEAPRPNRRRKAGGSAAPVADSLQLVETSAPVPQEPQLGDALPQRTRPRRKRGAQAESGPLMLVETQGGQDTPQGDKPGVL